MHIFTEVLSNAHRLHGFEGDEMVSILILGLDDDHTPHFPFSCDPNGNGPLLIHLQYTLEIITI